MVRQKSVKLLMSSRAFKNSLPVYVNRNTESFQSRFHSHDFFEIAYVAEGKGYHHINSQVLPAAKGDLFVLPVGVTHVFRPSSLSGHELVVYNCTFKEELLDDWPEEWGARRVLGLLKTGDIRPADAAPGGQSLNSDGWFVLHNAVGEFEGLFRELYSEYRRMSEDRHLMLISLIMQLLVRVARRRTVHRPQAESRKHAELEPILEYMAGRLAEPLTLSGLAERSGMSQRHLHRLLKARTGMSFTAYVQSLRIERSCTLLRTTSMPVEEVAEAVGYRNLDSFYRIFKRIAGCTPGEYRKRDGGPGEDPLRIRGRGSSWPEE